MSQRSGILLGLFASLLVSATPGTPVPKPGGSPASTGGGYAGTGTSVNSVITAAFLESRPDITRGYTDCVAVGVGDDDPCINYVIGWKRQTTEIEFYCAWDRCSADAPFHTPIQAPTPVEPAAPANSGAPGSAPVPATPNPAPAPLPSPDAPAPSPIIPSPDTAAPAPAPRARRRSRDATVFTDPDPPVRPTNATLVASPVPLASPVVMDRALIPKAPHDGGTLAAAGTADGGAWARQSGTGPDPTLPSGGGGGAGAGQTTVSHVPPVPTSTTTPIAVTFTRTANQGPVVPSPARMVPRRVVMGANCGKYVAMSAAPQRSFVDGALRSLTALVSSFVSTAAPSSTAPWSATVHLSDGTSRDQDGLQDSYEYARQGSGGASPSPIPPVVPPSSPSHPAASAIAGGSVHTTPDGTPVPVSGSYGQVGEQDGGVATIGGTLIEPLMDECCMKALKIASCTINMTSCVCAGKVYQCPECGRETTTAGSSKIFIIILLVLLAFLLIACAVLGWSVFRRKRELRALGEEVWSDLWSSSDDDVARKATSGDDEEDDDAAVAARSAARAARKAKAAPASAKKAAARRRLATAAAEAAAAAAEEEKEQEAERARQALAIEEMKKARARFSSSGAVSFYRGGAAPIYADGIMSFYPGGTMPILADDDDDDDDNANANTAANTAANTYGNAASPGAGGRLGMSFRGDMAAVFPMGSPGRDDDAASIYPSGPSMGIGDGDVQDTHTHSAVHDGGRGRRATLRAGSPKGVRFAGDDDEASPTGTVAGVVGDSSPRYGTAGSPTSRDLGAAGSPFRPKGGAFPAADDGGGDGDGLGGAGDAGGNDDVYSPMGGGAAVEFDEAIGRDMDDVAGGLRGAMKD